MNKRGTPAIWYDTTTNGTDFEAIFIRRKDAAEAGLIYTPQFSADLVTWTDSTATPTVVADGGEVEAARIRFPLFPAGPEARFFRMGLRRPPATPLPPDGRGKSAHRDSSLH